MVRYMVKATYFTVLSHFQDPSFTLLGLSAEILKYLIVQSALAQAVLFHSVLEESKGCSNVACIHPLSSHLVNFYATSLVDQRPSVQRNFLWLGCDYPNSVISTKQ